MLSGAAGCWRRTSGDCNVVLIVVDTLRADHLPFYGYGKQLTPFLSSLAEKGVVFENAYSPSSWTAPATASILTSLYPFQHGLTMGFFAQKEMIKRKRETQVNRIPKQVTTLAERLKSHGYQTFGVADNINISSRLGFDQGFDNFVSHLHRSGRIVNSSCRKFLGQSRKDKYFLYIHYDDPHTPYHVSLPANLRTGDWREDLKVNYDLEIEVIDRSIRELYNLFYWGEKTLLIITADHGEEFFDHGRLGHGRTLFNEVIRVPFLVHFPEFIKAGRRVEENVSTLDIFPTIIDWVDAGSAKDLAGISLVPVLKSGKKTTGERAIFSHLQLKKKRRRSLLLKASIFQKQKYIFRAPDSHLYFDLASDPAEQKDLYGAALNEAKTLADHLARFEKNCPYYKPDEISLDLSQEEIEHLRSLGYID
jgi:arylsulfatase A-like enzyme